MSVLTLEKLSKSYGSDTVLEKIDLSVAAGEVVALLGKSGSGKSTLLKCINQLEHADAGAMTVVGQVFDFNDKPSFAKAAVKTLRQHVGMVFQHFCLWPHLTVLQNLTLAPKKLKLMSSKQADKEALALLERFELAHKAKSFPSSLSGGQQQRVSIARSLMLKPKIMLFDEPTSALDPEMTQEVLTIIHELKKDNMAMLISSHEIGFAKSIADKVCFLSKGNIIECGDASIIDKPATNEFKQFLTHTYH
jgi:ABC-type polar amino acid transport system ATPase subunit